MKLTGKQRGALQNALLDAYRSQDDLSQMLLLQMNENLEAIAGRTTLTDVVLKLVNWAEARGRLREFVAGAHNENPNNATLKQWVENNKELLLTIDDTAAESDKPLMPNDAEDPWWEQLPDMPSNVAGIDLAGKNRDVIIGTVGSGAKNVAIGKNITQNITEIIGKPQADDAALIREKIQTIAHLLNDSDIDPRTAGKADVHIEMLADELAQTNADEPPNSKTVIRIGDWLLDNVPEITQAITELFGMPAVGRMLGKAGDAAIDWARKRFG